MEVCPKRPDPNTPSGGEWQTRLVIFKNRAVRWFGSPYANPINWDFTLGDATLQSTFQQAQQIGAGMFVDIELAQNDYLIFLANDSTGNFVDNSGGVAINVAFSPGIPGPGSVQYILATPDTTPGGGSPGEVFLFTFAGTDSLASLPAIPANQTDAPNYVAFSPTGELFVSNHNGGSISRFTIDTNGNYSPNGTITGNSLESVHGLAFSGTGELFAANWLNGTISRFLFGAQGNAIPNGTITTGGANQGLAFSSGGELFNTDFGANVRRFLFDSTTGTEIPNGSFAVSGASRLHGLAFNTQGELFIADPDNDRLVRFTFDNDGNPVSNGTIAVSGGPIDVAFSPAGELFVSCHFGGGLQRFLFDEAGTATPHGVAPFDHLGGVAISDPPTIPG